MTSTLRPMTTRLVILVCMTLSCAATFAQYNNSNSFMRRVILGYEMHSDGFYYPISDVLVDELNHVEAAYAYDKKAQNLYVRTNNCNCVVTLTKEYANVVKENKHIPQLKGGAIDMRVMTENKLIEDKFTRLNELRRTHLEDSVAKVRADSIERARQDSLRKVREAREMAAYASSHDWQRMAFADGVLSCHLCENTLKVKDTLTCVALHDSIFYYREEQPGDLGLTIPVLHATTATPLLADKRFKLHTGAFKDSLTMIELDADMVETMNSMAYMDYVEALRTTAPHGYVASFDWQQNDSTALAYKVCYMNTNEKSIKTIDAYYQVTDGEGKVLKSGHNKADSPMEYMQQGEMTASIPIALSGIEGVEMKITKVVVTYEDGTKGTSTNANP